MDAAGTAAAAIVPTAPVEIPGPSAQLSYDPDQHGSAPFGWHRDFADVRQRLRDWVTTSGTRLERDRATRQTAWPGEPPADAVEETTIGDRDDNFALSVIEDVASRRESELRFYARRESDAVSD